MEAIMAMERIIMARVKVINMFMICFDDKLAKELEAKGFKKMKAEDGYTVFAYNPNINFAFDNIDKSRLFFTRKLTF